MPTQRYRLWVVWLTVFIDLVGFGIVLPILPYYAQHYGAQGFGIGAIMSAYSAMQFIATAVLGRLSDRYGRRPILLTTIAINVAGYLLFAFAGSYAALFISRLVSGFAGGNISAAQAYIADVTPPERRSRSMGLIGMAFGLGFIVGPAIGGLASHYGGHSAPGLVAAGLSLVNLVSAFLILPESLRAEHRVVRALWDFAHLRKAVMNPRIRPLMAVWALVPLAFAGYSLAVPLFAKVTFGWAERDLGMLFTVVGITAAIVQGWLFGKLHRVTGDRALVIAGTVGMAVAVGVVPFLHSTGWLYAWTVPLAFSNSVMAPAATGLVSLLADVTEQGGILGAAQSLSALGRLTGPLVIGEVYDVLGPRTAFLAAAAVMVLGALVATGLERIPKPHAAAQTGANPAS